MSQNNSNILNIVQEKPKEVLIMDNLNNEKNESQLINTNNISEGKDFNNNNDNHNFQNKFF